jgi:hypothetical protein
MCGGSGAELKFRAANVRGMCGGSGVELKFRAANVQPRHIRPNGPDDCDKTPVPADREKYRMHHHHRDDHDDMGGLHRDLAATGAVMDRRGMLRLAAR